MDFTSTISLANGGYESGQASQQRFTQCGGRGSTSDRYGNHDANLFNHDIKDEHNR